MSQGDWWLLPSFAGEDAGLRAGRPLVQGCLEPSCINQDRLGFAAVTPRCGSRQQRFSSCSCYKAIWGRLGLCFLVTLALGPRLSKQPSSDALQVPTAEGRETFHGGLTLERKCLAWKLHILFLLTTH